MKHFNIQQLMALDALMKTGSVTNAADYLGVTQPTVSRQLKLFEDFVGFRIFDRKSGGRLVATPTGKRLYNELSDTINVLCNLSEVANNVSHYQSDRLGIVATTPLLACEILIESIKKLREIYPLSMVHFERRNLAEIEAFVANGHAEIGLCSLPISNPNLDVHELLTTEAVAVLASDHRLADRDTLSINDVPNDEIILSTAPPIQSHMSYYMQELKGRRPPPLRVHLVLTGFHLAAAGLGVHVCDPLTAAAFADDRVRVVRWVPKIAITYGIVLSKDLQLPAIVNDLVELLKTQAGSWKSDFECHGLGPKLR